MIDELLKSNLSTAYQARLEKLFATSKNLAIKTFTDMKLKESAVILKRIAAIKLYWPKN
ncbi:MAG: hypothetical protein H7336_17170 [Bacteriovorax sp.]|nr:hypothetical protein [Bacteriovorax sp.]